MAVQPCLSRQVKFETFRRAIEQAGLEDLRLVCIELARLATVVQPAFMQHLVEDAAEARHELMQRDREEGRVAPKFWAMAQEQGCSADHHS